MKTPTVTAALLAALLATGQQAAAGGKGLKNLTPPKIDVPNISVDIPRAPALGNSVPAAPSLGNKSLRQLGDSASPGNVRPQGNNAAPRRNRYENQYDELPAELRKAQQQRITEELRNGSRRQQLVPTASASPPGAPVRRNSSPGQLPSEKRILQNQYDQLPAELRAPRNAYGVAPPPRNAYGRVPQRPPYGDVPGAYGNAPRPLYGNAPPPRNADVYTRAPARNNQYGQLSLVPPSNSPYGRLTLAPPPAPPSSFLRRNSGKLGFAGGVGLGALGVGAPLAVRELTADE